MVVLIGYYANQLNFAIVMVNAIKRQIQGSLIINDALTVEIYSLAKCHVLGIVMAGLIIGGLDYEL